MRYIVLIIFTTFFIACSKKQSEPKGPPPCTSETHTKITNQKFLDFVFKQGSYWVYKDSLNNNFHDTLLLYYPPYFEDVKTSQYGCNFVEQFNMKSWSRLMIEQTDRDYIIKPDSFITFSNYQNSKAAVMFLPKGTANNPCRFYDSLFIYDRYYKDVVQSDTIKGNNGISYKMICFFNSQFGFLRNDLYNTNNQLISRKVLFAKNIVK